MEDIKKYAKETTKEEETIQTEETENIKWIETEVTNNEDELQIPSSTSKTELEESTKRDTIELLIYEDQTTLKVVKKIDLISNYLYIDEHLRILKNNTTFTTFELDNYLQLFLYLVSANSKGQTLKDHTILEQLRKYALMIRYLRYQSKLKREKKKKRNKQSMLKDKEEPNSSTKDSPHCKQANEKSVSDEKIREVSMVDTYYDSVYSNDDNSSSSSSSFVSESSSDGESSDFDVSIEEEISKLSFDKEELHKVKHLERSKNIYMIHIRNLSEKYEIGTKMNLEFFQKATEAFIDFDKSISNTYKKLLNDNMKLITEHYENKEVIDSIQDIQNKKRTDVIDAMFNTGFIPLMEPMKHPIKDMDYFSKSKNLGKMPSVIPNLNIRRRIYTQRKTLKNSKKKEEKKSGSPSRKVQNLHTDKNETTQSIIVFNKKREQKETQLITEKKEPNVENESSKNIQEAYKKNRWSGSTFKTYLQIWPDLKKHMENKIHFYIYVSEHMHILHESHLKCMEGITKKQNMIIERREKERLKCLRENNMDEYINLLKNQKLDRLRKMVEKTEYMMNILRRSLLIRQILYHQNNQTQVDSAPLPQEDLETNADGSSKAVKETFKTCQNEYFELCHSKEEIVQQPSILTGGKLKDYQMEGLRWLISLYNNKVNGILADEMGLGKTIQTISVFAYVKEFKNVPDFKALVIAPLSTIPNWVNEFKQWVPSMKVLEYRGNKVARLALKNRMLTSDIDVCITTFNFMILDKSVFMKREWEYIVVDEAHRMKNQKCRVHEIVSGFKSRNRLLLTGTPLQNNIMELWSLLNFLLPDLFTSSDNFSEWFEESIDNENQEPEAQLTKEEQLILINRLHNILYPFMLRRLKTEVGLNHLKKEEYNVFVQPSLTQKILNEQIERRFVCSSKITSSGYRQNKEVPVQNNEVELRKVANHPFLYVKNYDINEFIIRSSGKFEVLDRMLPKLLKFKHKILIFCQMTNLLDIMCDYLDLRDYNYYRMDGTVNVQMRQEMIDAFNKNYEGDSELEKIYIFLISTKSGNVGINLQAADTVILYDSDLNPHQDFQAIARCCRIGQKNLVKVFRFIVCSSIECKILKRSLMKLRINDKVIEAGCYNPKYNEEERKDKLNECLEKKIENTEENYKNPTNPILLNYYMKRNNEELHYFLNYDKEYFGEDVFNKLHALVAHEDVLSEFIEKQNKDHVMDKEKESTEEPNPMETKELDDKNEESRRKRKHSLLDKVEEIQTEGKEIKNEIQHMNNENEAEVKVMKPTQEEINSEKEKKEGEKENNKESLSKQGVDITSEGNLENNKRFTAGEKDNSKKEMEWIDYERLLDETNYNTIERILIQSKKLINKEEVPAYLLIQKISDEEIIIPYNYKRDRKQVTREDFVPIDTCSFEDSDFDEKSETKSTSKNKQSDNKKKRKSSKRASENGSNSSNSVTKKKQKN